MTVSFQAQGQLLDVDEGWQQGAMIKGRVQPGSTVVFAERQLKISPDGYFVIGLGRDAEAEAILLVESADGIKQQHRFNVKPRSYVIQRVEGVPQKTVTPDPKQVQRAKAEAALAWNARQKESGLEDFRDTFIWPVKGPVTGVYGSQRFYNGTPRSPHYGVDIARPKGTLVAAPAAGIVSLVHNDMFYSGGTLIVDHGYGISSTFIHLSEILVAPGDTVKQGQAIAKIGATGRATGPHLDWRMNWFEVRLDPQLVVGPMPSSGSPVQQP